MDKNSTLLNLEKEEKPQTQPKLNLKKNRRIKRKPFTRKKPAMDSHK